MIPEFDWLQAVEWLAGGVGAGIGMGYIPHVMRSTKRFLEDTISD